jgi:hypothetical protein
MLPSDEQAPSAHATLDETTVLLEGSLSLGLPCSRAKTVQLPSCRCRLSLENAALPNARQVSQV